MSESLYIGLLSGTSADAIDGALIDFSQEPPKLISTHSHPISEKLRKAIFDLAEPAHNEIETMRWLDQALAVSFSETALALCEESGIGPERIKAIGSHGQTIRHYPPSKGQRGYTLQVGDANLIAELTGITTVADIRRRDIAAMGHGAPLAPIVHQALFQHTSKDRIVLNTGGIANITYLPTEGEVLGFDTGPANGMMDSWCQHHKGLPYDESGQWAATGQLVDDLLEQFLQTPYFQLPIPKSTGRELFNLSWVQEQLRHYKTPLKPEDVQASLLQLTVETIALGIEQVDKDQRAEVFICGGGAHNNLLCERLQTRIGPRPLASTETLGVSPDWVEAILFAWIAKQTINRVGSNIASVTGASREVILGGVYWGNCL